MYFVQQSKDLIWNPLGWPVGNIDILFICKEIMEYALKPSETIIFGFLLQFAGYTTTSTMRVDNAGLFNLVYGAFGLPFGLLMTVLTGAELFTSNTSYLVAGAFEVWYNASPVYMAEKWSF